jgi:hypothetical protein
VLVNAGAHLAVLDFINVIETGGNPMIAKARRRNPIFAPAGEAIDAVTAATPTLEGLSDSTSADEASTRWVRPLRRASPAA